MTLAERPYLAWTLLRRQLDPSVFDEWSLSEDDAQVGSVIITAYVHYIGRAARLEAKGEVVPPDVLAELQRAAEWQRQQGLKLLSDSARTRLGPILEELREVTAQMVGGRVAPLQAAARIQEVLRDVEQQGGAVIEGRYTPYEWARLCRTEAQFAETTAYRAEFEAAGASFAAIDELGALPPIHPNCMCAIDQLEHMGQVYAVLSPAPTACDICLDLAHQVATQIGL